MQSTEHERFSVDFSSLNFADGFWDNEATRLLIAVKQKVPFKSVVVCVRSENLSEFISKNSSWRISESLNAAFKYFRADGEAALEGLKITGLKEGDTISVEPWWLGEIKSVYELIEGIYQQGNAGGIKLIERLA